MRKLYAATLAFAAIQGSHITMAADPSVRPTNDYPTEATLTAERERHCIDAPAPST